MVGVAVAVGEAEGVGEAGRGEGVSEGSGVGEGMAGCEVSAGVIGLGSTVTSGEQPAISSASRKYALTGAILIRLLCIAGYYKPSAR